MGLDEELGLRRKLFRVSPKSELETKNAARGGGRSLVMAKLD